MSYILAEVDRDGPFGNGMVTGVSKENAQASVTYQLTNAIPGNYVDIRDLHFAIQDLIGTVDNLGVVVSRHDEGPHGGKIRRRLPRAHPWLPIPVGGITAIRGLFNDVQSVNPVPQPLYTPGQQTYALSQFPNYKAYAIEAQFSKRDYAIVDDAYIKREEALYWAPGKALNNPAQFYYAREWERFTQLTINPLADTLEVDSAQTDFGQMRFRSSDAAIDDRQFPGSIRVPLRNAVVEIMWYEVPFRYFFDFTIGGQDYPSYLMTVRNVINQRDWYGFPAGSLLYLNAIPMPYLPALPNQLRLDGLSTAATQQQLCNVKLQFLYTARQASDLPPLVGGEEFNLNFNAIPAGHNLMPNYASRKFYYVSTETQNAADRRPAFNSFPFELFFTDPLLRQPDPNFTLEGL